MACARANKPNLNRIHLTKMENVREPQNTELQHSLIEHQISGNKLKTILWSKESKDIAESEDLKLVIFNQSLRGKNLQTKMKDCLENKGETPRVYRNTLLFLTALDNEREHFDLITRRRIAYEMIIKDAALNLAPEDRKNIQEILKKEDDALKGQVKTLYRLVYVPAKNETLKQVNLGIPTYGDKKSLDESVYEQLRIDGEITEKISSVVLANKYLHERNCAKTKPSRIETLKEMAQALGLNPEEILTKEALSIPNRTIVSADRAIDENQVNTLLKALKQRLKEDLRQKPVSTTKTVEITV